MEQGIAPTPTSPISERMEKDFSSPISELREKNFYLQCLATSLYPVSELSRAQIALAYSTKAHLAPSN